MEGAPRSVHARRGCPSPLPGAPSAPGRTSELLGPYILPWDQLALWIPELSSALASRGARKRKMQK